MRLFHLLFLKAVRAVDAGCVAQVYLVLALLFLIVLTSLVHIHFIELIDCIFWLALVGHVSEAVFDLELHGLMSFSKGGFLSRVAISLLI